MSSFSHFQFIRLSCRTLRTTTHTGKNQKISKKLQEDSVEALKSIRFSLKNLSMINWMSSLNQWRMSLLEECGKISKRTKIMKNNQKFKKKLLKLVTSKS